MVSPEPKYTDLGGEQAGYGASCVQVALYVQDAMSDLQLQKPRMGTWIWGNYEWFQVTVCGASGTRA